MAETDPIQQSFDPWTVVADANGEFDTSWYVFSSDFNGATFLATATGESSQLTASATFTDAAGDGSGTMNVSPSTTTPNSTGNSFTFSFRTEAVAFASGQVTLQVPTVPSGTNWTQPQSTNPANPGFVSVSNVGGGNASIGVISAGPPWTIPVNFTGAAGGTDGFNLTYGGGTNATKVQAPSTASAYSFVTKTKVGGGGALVEIDADPIIAVSTSSIFQRGSTTTGSGMGLATLTINKPTGVVAGDVMIASITLDSGGGNGFPSSSGWTPYTSTRFPDAATGGRRTILLYRVAGTAPFTPATEPSSYIFSWTGSSNVSGAITAFGGVNNTTPFDTATPPPYQVNSNTGPITANAITTLTANDAVIMFGATQTDQLIPGPFTTVGGSGPGALTESFANITKGIGGAWNFFPGSPGTTGTGSATLNANKDWAGVLIALRPGSCTGTCVVTIGGQGNPQTVEGCPATAPTPSFTAPTASDTCGGQPTINPSDSTSGNNCSKTFTRTWQATDACGSTSATVSQSITVHDTTGPTIGAAGGPATIQCPATPTFTAPTASDTCNGATVNLVSDTSAAGSCAGTYTRTQTWDATDACGNHSATRSQTITVADTTAPTIGSPGAANTVECPASPSFTAPTASDTCSGATVTNLGDTTSGNACALVTTRSWRAVDGCGNTSGTVTQTSTRVDTTNPVLAIQRPTLRLSARPHRALPRRQRAMRAAAPQWCRTAIRLLRAVALTTTPRPGRGTQWTRAGTPARRRAGR